MIGALKSANIQLFDPSPIREFIFRDDHVKGYLKCLETDKCIVQTINLCTGEGISIGDAAQKVATIGEEMLGKKIEVNFSNQPDRTRDIPLLVGDNAKAKALLSWTPDYNLDAGLRKAMKEWREVLGL